MRGQARPRRSDRGSAPREGGSVRAKRWFGPRGAGSVRAKLWFGPRGELRSERNAGAAGANRGSGPPEGAADRPERRFRTARSSSGRSGTVVPDRRPQRPRGSVGARRPPQVQAQSERNSSISRAAQERGCSPWLGDYPGPPMGPRGLRLLTVPGAGNFLARWRTNAPQGVVGHIFLGIPQVLCFL